MSRLEMVRADVVDSANRIEEAATAVDGIEAGTTVERIASALPGSDSAAKAGTLASTWTQEYNTWASDVRDHAESMRNASALIEESDLAVATGWGGGPPGGPGGPTPY